MIIDKMPKRIWAWKFLPKHQNEDMKGGWDDNIDPREVAFVQSGAAEGLIKALNDAKAVIRIEGKHQTKFIDVAIEQYKIDTGGFTPDDI